MSFCLVLSMFIEYISSDVWEAEVQENWQEPERSLSPHYPSSHMTQMWHKNSCCSTAADSLLFSNYTTNPICIFRTLPSLLFFLSLFSSLPVARGHNHTTRKSIRKLIKHDTRWAHSIWMKDIGCKVYLPIRRIKSISSQCKLFPTFSIPSSHFVLLHFLCSQNPLAFTENILYHKCQYCCCTHSCTAHYRINKETQSPSTQACRHTHTERDYYTPESYSSQFSHTIRQREPITPSIEYHLNKKRKKPTATHFLLHDTHFPLHLSLPSLTLFNSG